MYLKNKITNLILVDNSLLSSKADWQKNFINNGYITVIDFSKNTYQNTINEILSKDISFDNVTLFSSSTTREAENVSINGKQIDFTWSGNLSISKEQAAENNSNIHNIFKWNFKKENLKSDEKAKDLLGNKLVGKEKKLKNSEEKDLKSKFKTKEEYEIYIQKLKSEAVMKKETYSEKEKDLKLETKSKNEYFKIKEASTDIIEKGKVGFWKHKNGQKKLMKEYDLKLKDQDGKEVIGDFKISKDGKVDLKNIKSGKYSAKIKLENNDLKNLNVSEAVNIKDAMLLLNYIGKSNTLDQDQLIAGNISRKNNEDNDIDIKDIMGIINIIGKIDTVDSLELRPIDQENKNNKSLRPDFFEVNSGDIPALQCYLLGDVDGSLVQNLL